MKTNLLSVVSVLSLFALGCGTKTPQGEQLGGGKSLAAKVKSQLPGGTTSNGQSVPCSVLANAITATGDVTLMANSGSLVDSYDSNAGPYGGSNVGSNGNVIAGGSIRNNGGIIKGQQLPNMPSSPPVPTIPSDAINLPLGSSTPGSLNINQAVDSVTLAPGTYVVDNVNVNSPGAINISPAGQVTIFVTGSLNLGGNENLNGVPDNLTFIATQAGWVNINANGKLFGGIYAPTSAVALNSSVFGYVVGKSVTLNTGAAVHYDENGACPTFTLTPTPPRTLPAPPNRVGCYGFSDEHWVTVPCTPPDQMSAAFPLPIASEPMIQSNAYLGDGGVTTIPLEFAQTEATFVTVDPVTPESDSLRGNDALSLQLNTNTFLSSNGTGDTGWVQFVIQTAPSSGARICLWQVDTTVACQTRDDAGACTNPAGYPQQCVGGGSNTNGTNEFVVGQRAGDFKAFDFATIGGSTFVDAVTGNKDIGLVAQMSFFDPKKDYTANGNGKGIYAVVVQDTIGLNGVWTQASGTFLGEGGGSKANFTNTAILTRQLAGSCANATGPAPDVPWPGVCPTQPVLLPHTSLSSGGGTAETNNLPLVGTPTALVSASPDLVYTEYLMSNASAITTVTKTATGTRTITVTVTDTSSATSTGTTTKTATQTGTATSTSTSTSTSTGTRTTTGTITLTNTQTVTGIKTITATSTVTGTFTGTRTGTLTSTGTVTATRTATGTATWSGTYSGTGTATGTRTFTDTMTGTVTVSGTLTITATGTRTNTGTKTATGTSIATGSHTATQTFTARPTATVTNTATNTVTNTVTRTNTVTNTSTVTNTTTSSTTHTATNTATGTSTATGITCTSKASPIFVKTSDEDVGVRPFNIRSQPFWESPDLFLVPQGSPVDVNGVSSENLVTPGDNFDVWVRVNNDFGCSAIDGAKSLVYIAQPSALSTQWIPISNSQYLGGTNGANPNGVTVPAGGRALIGPFTFAAPTSGFGSGHVCLMAAIEALPGEPGPSNTTDPLTSAQVAQRNLQFSNCVLPLTNATLATGNVALTLSTTPAFSGGTGLSVTLDDPNSTFFGIWQPGQAGGGYTMTQSNGQTTVILGDTSVTLAPVPIAAGQSVNATAAVTPGAGQPTTTLRVQASLNDPVTGNLLVANGLSCVASGSSGSGGAGGGGAGGSGGGGAGGIGN